MNSTIWKGRSSSIASTRSAPTSSGVVEGESLTVKRKTRSDVVDRDQHLRTTGLGRRLRPASGTGLAGREILDRCHDHQSGHAGSHDQRPALLPKMPPRLLPGQAHVMTLLMPGGLPVRRAPATPPAGACSLRVSAIDTCDRWPPRAPAARLPRRSSLLPL